MSRACSGSFYSSRPVTENEVEAIFQFVRAGDSLLVENSLGLYGFPGNKYLAKLGMFAASGIEKEQRLPYYSRPGRTPPPPEHNVLVALRTLKKNRDNAVAKKTIAAFWWVCDITSTYYVFSQSRGIYASELCFIRKISSKQFSYNLMFLLPGPSFPRRTFQGTSSWATCTGLPCPSCGMGTRSTRSSTRSSWRSSLAMWVTSPRYLPGSPSCAVYFAFSHHNP